MPVARRLGCRVTFQRALRCAFSVALMLVATPVLACRTDPPAATPMVVELAAQADLVAIISVSGQVPVSAIELALAERQRRGLPFNTPSLPPAPGATFTTVGVLKGPMPAGGVIDSGTDNAAIHCDMWLESGRDNVFFAKLPASDGARLWPLRGTFALGNTVDEQARLATVVAALSSSQLTHP